MTIIGFLIALVIFLLILWVVKMLLAAFAIGEPISTIIWVIVVILAVIYLLGALSGHTIGIIG